MAMRIECKDCGHSAHYHTGVSKAGYSAPKLACTFHTDRYEVCKCDKLKLDRDEALEIAVKYDGELH